uniref:BIG2 domain-containing protein n=1 Tax=Strongyloides venezuelensis TaxID=75913 RepID=A0A0K0F183_STRVS
MVEDSNFNSNKKGYIIGGAISAIILVMIAILICIIIRKNRQCCTKRKKGGIGSESTSTSISDKIVQIKVIPKNSNSFKAADNIQKSKSVTGIKSGQITILNAKSVFNGKVDPTKPDGTIVKTVAPTTAK